MENTIYNDAVAIFTAHELHTVNDTVANALIYVNRMIRDNANKDYWQSIKIELEKMKVYDSN